MVSLLTHRRRSRCTTMVVVPYLSLIQVQVLSLCREVDGVGSPKASRFDQKPISSSTFFHSITNTYVYMLIYLEPPTQLVLAAIRTRLQSRPGRPTSPGTANSTWTLCPHEKWPAEPSVPRDVFACLAPFGSNI